MEGRSVSLILGDYSNIYNNNIYLKSNIHSIIRYKFSGIRYKFSGIRYKFSGDKGSYKITVILIAY